MKRLFDAFDAAGEELFLVGGAVRDLAMGTSPEELDDLDFATGALPRVTLGILRKAGFGTYDVGMDFGTVGATLRGPRPEGYPKDVQITTYRSAENYRRGSRHPVVSFGTSITEDLWRRDFSINSIAMDAHGNYVDPYDGRADIEAGVLRAVGDPRERLAEDPLRILRIARFMAKLGFVPHPALRQAAEERANWLLDIARQRWLQEMTKLVCGPFAPDALRFLLEVGALGVILPELVELARFSERTHTPHWDDTRMRTQRVGDDRVLSWAALFADAGRPWTAGGAAPFHNHAIMASVLFKGVSRRFHFDNATGEAVEHLLAHQRSALAYRPEWTDADIRRLVRELGANTDRAVALGDVLDSDGDGVDLVGLRRRIDALSASGRLIPELPSGLGGVLMKALELRPGPLVGEIVDWLMEQIIDGEIASRLPPQEYVDHLLRAQPPILRKTPRFGRH